jgi:hypothetical protein
VEIVIGPVENNWGRPGRRPQEIPENIRAALDATYKTGQCGRVPIETPEDHAEAMEFVNLARSYARQKKVRVIFQPRDPRNAKDKLLFQLRDRGEE